MTDRDYDMSGILFRETDKKSEKSPDYTGKLTLGGEEYRLAGWIREGKKGKFLSLKVSTYDDAPARKAQQEADSEIPF
jgi:hypothetical protein